MKRRMFYQITTEGRTANIDIYGDISQDPYDWWTGEKTKIAAKDIKSEISGLDVDVINVYINSYGGEVAEALAIYSVLKRHTAKVHTYCDGFACSAATIIFCAGDERTMGSIALMMIHNCMSYVGYANSDELRKAAEDNDKINQSSIEAYKLVSSLSEEKIRTMMGAETWLTAKECLEYGFATEIADMDDEETVQQSAFGKIREFVLSNRHSDEKLDKLCLMVQQVMDAVVEHKKTREGDPSDLDTPEQTEKETEVAPAQPDIEQKRAARFFASLI